MNLDFGFIYRGYKQEREKYERWKDLYFNEVLVKFHIEYIQNYDMNIGKFIKKVKLFEKEFVPSYVIYLVKNEEYERLKKVFIVDYMDSCPSQRNAVLKTMNKAGDVWIILKMIVVIAIFGLAGYTLGMILTELFLYSMRGVLKVQSVVIELITFIICVCTIKISSVYLSIKNDYTFKTERIKTIINQRENFYNEMADSFFYTSINNIRR